MSPDTPELRQLLEDCRRWIDATRAQWEVMARDETKCCGHLAKAGKALVRRLDDALPTGSE